MTDNAQPTIEELKASLEVAENEWFLELGRRRKAEKTLECCLELIKYLQK